METKGGFPKTQMHASYVDETQILQMHVMRISMPLDRHNLKCRKRMHQIEWDIHSQESKTYTRKHTSRHY